MKCPVETRCLVCFLTFCCSDCRWNHEKAAHGLQYDCCMCRGQPYLCKPEDLTNQEFLKHLVNEHLPLQCKKCQNLYSTMDELSNIKECTSITELIDKDETKLDEKFDSIYNKASIEGETFEAIVSVNKSTRTAVITPVVRQKHLVDYESSDSEECPSPKIQIATPHPKLQPKTPKLKRQRAATPHVKKFMSLIRQKVVEDYHAEEEKEMEESPVGNKTTPVRKEEGLAPASDNQVTTPTSHMNERCLQLTQAVTTSTPTHPATSGWTMFPEQGNDSPLSEIEGTTADSPAQTLDQDPSKSTEAIPKLKSIITTSSRLRLGSQDSSEKQVTFQDSASNTDGSVRAKKVKFAEDTVFEQENKVKRIFRKPKRMLTPGPQRPNRFCFNPRFQALINRFENQGVTVARTPINSNRQPNVEPRDTPGTSKQANKLARAIDFKEDSPVVEEKDTNELFKSCVESPPVNSGGALNTAISALTNNIAGSLQDCLSTALKPEEEETEIQFKFVITKRKVTVKKLEDGTVGSTAVIQDNKENIWSSVARAVKNVFWSDEGINFASTTPVARSHRSNDSTASSGSKRKLDELSDSESPVNHKRHKYAGRIRGRPPLPRAATAVALLRSSHSLEQQSLLQEVNVWGSWGLPAFMCDIYIAMDVTSSTSSIFNLVAISVDRYIAVTQPIKYAKHKNNRRVWFTIVLVWLISAAIGAPIVLGLNDTPDRNFDECLFNSQNYVIYSSLGSFYIPCIMMMFLYYSIFKALRNRAKKQRAAKKPPVSGDPNTGATQAVVIENVVQTRRLAETALHDDKPTNTGSGSNEDEHEDSLERQSLEVDADECHVIPNDKSTDFMLTTVTEESMRTPKKFKSASQVQDPNGNNDSGYAPSNIEDTLREHASPPASPPASPALKEATVLQNMACVENGARIWRKNGRTAQIESDSRNASLQLHTTTEDLTASHLDLHDGSSSKKERKASAATARFTIYKANKASKKKREKSSAKKERKATKTLAIVLGVFLFCWAPFFTCNVLDAICGKFGLDYSPGVTVFILTTWLGYINSFLNPVIYTIFNPEFRKAFRKILRCGT